MDIVMMRGSMRHHSWTRYGDISKQARYQLHQVSKQMQKEWSSLLVLLFTIRNCIINQEN